MALPPFPSQDLAKLVLGYLAEEQLMTAYDEFLQASPYLDALKNEYDRIFMTSLRNILAEYRAVKIFVETCKPFVLRRKLIQCTNLLDVVKFLVNHVDVKKVQAQDVTTDKTSQGKQNSSESPKRSCDLCCSDVVSCICNKQSDSSVNTSQTSSHVEITCVDNSVETTALEDLPGNHLAVRKKHIKALEKETIILGSNSNLSNSNAHSKQSSGNTSHGASGQSLPNSYTNNITQSKNCDNLSALGLNCMGSPVISADSLQANDTQNVENKTPSTTNFEDFVSGVSVHKNRNDPVPDSSTSENNSFQNNKQNINNLICSNRSNKLQISKNEGTSSETCHYIRVKPKSKEQKIKILSDIKVDRPFNTNNATSTPLTQTILINGTQAYKQNKQKPTLFDNNYTKDEIMAMPTIIVVPSAGHTRKATDTQSTPSQNVKQITENVSSTRLLGPLVIDVPSSSLSTHTVLNLQSADVDAGLVKTVDITKNASVPKDNTVTCAAETNTPQVQPLVRKSSSTPRRNSHVRVLDFTAPRRVLHETITEDAPTSYSNVKPVEVILSSSPNVTDKGELENNLVHMSTVKVHKIDSSNIIKSSNINTKNKRNSWDTDLRSLAIANEDTNEINHQAKVKIKKTRKKTTESESHKKKGMDSNDINKLKAQKILSPKIKKPKHRRKVDEEDDDDSVKIVEKTVNVPLIPTINIIPVEKYGNKKPNDSKQNKVNDDQANITPEADRISLQNVIGAKLNISDLLETPYKQALYDIQMETPKFLGPDLPDEPISDIKIMNIPTPRFFDTPRTEAQATPSSYSSRPTDYSSGGSYYKPDDQDFTPIPDIESSACRSELNKERPKDSENGDKRITQSETDGKRKRPVRQCTKNVSYINSSSATNKTTERDTEYKMEVASSCSDSTVVNSPDIKSNLKISKSKKLKSQSKTETKKKVGAVTKQKSSIKKPNTFMKIKPRRPTPTKPNHTRRKSENFQNVSKIQIKKKTIGKEKHIHMTPIISCAPTKSRRKSSTPRKLHSTKTFNSESSGHDSPEISTSIKENIPSDQNIASCQDSDNDQIALRWSDDGSQEDKRNEKIASNDIEDISKIKQYIETTVHYKGNCHDTKNTLHVDLIKRGFDAETAKIIERDLLGTPPDVQQHNIPCLVEIVESKKDDILEKSIETNTSCSNDLHIDQDAVIEEELELSVYEIHEESNNYIIASHDYTKDTPRGSPVKLKDKYNMEVCIDDGATIRLRANDLSFLFDIDPLILEEPGNSIRETEVAVRSICDFDKLYTPLKDPTKATCYEIFDSTLTSLDTPLKSNSPKQKTHEMVDIAIVIEEDKVDGKDKNDSRKRKRLCNSNSPEQSNDTKKTKAEAQYLLTSTNIQNIDIESVLKKLHGP